MIWLYAIRPTQLPPLRTATSGVDGAALWSVAVGEVAAVVSTHTEPAEPAPTRQAALDHAAVVEAAHRAGPVLPGRFATTFPSREALERALRARHDTLQNGLAKVAGHLEYGVRLAADTPGPQPTTTEATAATGRGYLEQLAAEQQAADAAAAAASQAIHAVDTAVGAHTTDRWQPATPPTGLLANLAYLVPSHRTTAFEEAVATVPQRCLAAVTCTGPWPPYSFTPPQGALLDER